jgi:hypothetical protein
MGLNWDDFGARMYDPEIARWNVLDPQADKAPAWTPFRFGFNNPLRYIDPDGNFEMSSTINYRYGISNTITFLPYIYQNKSPEFKAILEKHSGLSKQQTLAILEPGKGPRIQSSGEERWSRGQIVYSEFYGIPGADAKPLTVLSVDNVLSESNVGRENFETNRLFYEAILFAQAVKYGILKKWEKSDYDLLYKRKTGHLAKDAMMATIWSIALQEYSKEREKAAEDFLREAYGIRTMDDTGKPLLESKQKALDDINKSQAAGNHEGTRPSPSQKEEVKKP